MIRTMVVFLVLASLLGCSAQQAASSTEGIDSVADCVDQVSRSGTVRVSGDFSAFKTPTSLRSSDLERVCQREVELQALNPGVRRVIERWESIVICSRSGGESVLSCGLRQ